MKNKDITAVITSFRSETKILNCVKSLGNDLKIIVIENSNDIKLKEKLEFNFSNLKCILSGQNLGYAKGNNLGLSMVNTKYALIINPDAELQNQAIENFFLTIKDKPNFAIIAPYIQESKTKQIEEDKKKGIFEVQNVKGFAMFLNLAQCKEVGFFDENFFIYFEEIDLCKRLINQNKKIYLDTNIKIKHAGGTSHDESINHEMEKSRNWHWMWSSFYYHYKHYGYIKAFIRILPKFLSAISKIIFYKIISNNKKKDIYFCRFEGILNSILMRKSWYRPKIN
ncbi:glycosyltransferase [Pelagibacteraceae bacterium]|nr:glycosyltransferase [Pelagibacteraceae bacterium]